MPLKFIIANVVEKVLGQHGQQEKSNRNSQHSHNMKNVAIPRKNGSHDTCESAPKLIHHHSDNEKTNEKGNPRSHVSQSCACLTDFDMGEIVGTGTFAKVYLAKHRLLRKYFAIKVLKKAEIVRMNQIEHVLAERQVLSQLSFPFIVELYSTFQDHYKLYMVEEYVLGGELFKYLRRVGTFTITTAKFYAAEILLAVEYMHFHGVVYRDLKPENLLLDHRGHIKIADFGFAKMISDRTWTVCGTPEYIAPEIIRGNGYSKAVDWWAFGILLYEMLVGQPPFCDESHVRLYERIIKGKVHYPMLLANTAKDLIKKLLVVNHTRRLGNLKNGAKDVKNHKFFENTPWDALLKRAVRAPMIPAHNGEGDTSNFDQYSDDEDINEELPEDDSLEDCFAEF